ncbi:hypothetical protein [Butyrivibrio sp. VCB2001]|uniref:hypothetical protein n=1 Tax=Butyrivibrio sp. VCB2001 TaxID=1280667 RepID=UPI00040BCB2F|nr:hypothetical protein [Butyrivibrio sp. VCB2001]
MINYTNELNNQLNELNRLEKKTSNRLKSYKSLDKGRIRVSSSNGVVQYHFKKEGEEKEHYIPKIEIGKIRLLVQREYDEKVHKELTEMIKRLEKFNSRYDADRISMLYDKLPKGKRELIAPILPTRQMIIDEWYRTHPGGKNSYEFKHEFITLNGESVRSKSEKIIADYLKANGIPYVCEPEVILKDGSKACPDFAALNVRTNKTYYIEHLGLVDQERYATRNFNKLIDYEEVGIVLGINLIITMETEDRPLDMKVLEKKIKEYIL